MRRHVGIFGLIVIALILSNCETTGSGSRGGSHSCYCQPGGGP